MKLKTSLFIFSLAFVLTFFLGINPIYAADPCNAFNGTNATTCMTEDANLTPPQDCTWNLDGTCYDVNYAPEPGAAGCAAPSDCDDDQYCNSVSHECADKLDIGENCIIAEAYKCFTGVCQLILGGTKCICNNDSQCDEGEACSEQACVKKPGLGETCVGDATTSNCTAGKCLTFGTTKTCRAVCTSQADCTGTTYCFDPGGGADKYCAPKLAAEADCTAPDQCASGKCDKAAPDATIMSCIGGAAPGAGTGTGDATPVPSKEYDLPNFLGKGVTDPSEVIGRVVKYIMGFVGTIALVTFMYGGMLWLISGGREAYVDKGRDTMVWSAIGMVVVFASYILVDFVFKLLGQ